MDYEAVAKEFEDTWRDLRAAAAAMRIEVTVHGPGWRHDPTGECDGQATVPWCPECYQDLCPCQRVNHDSECEGYV